MRNGTRKMFNPGPCFLHDANGGRVEPDAIFARDTRDGATSELGTGLGLFLGTWKGVLTLTAAYNDAWHGKEEVVRLIDRCNVIVVQGLGVEQQI